MKLAVITCAVFESEEIARKRLWIFLASCRKFGIEPLLYGVGDRWTIYRDIKLTKQLAFLKSEALASYSHCLYTDSWDGMFTGPLPAIVGNYEELGSPAILASASHQLANVSEEEKRYPGVFPKEPKYRYPHVGGWMGEKDAMIAAFERMELNPEKTSDDCFDWFDGVRDGWFRPEVDDTCQIFQVTAEDCSAEGGTLVNLHTLSLPCVFHLPGGYCHQSHGKDDTLIPWAIKLNIISQDYANAVVGGRSAR